MVYFPKEPPNLDSAERIRDWSRDEFRAISKLFGETDALELRTRFTPPTKPREGMIVTADGTSWNPGSGGGAYVFFGGLWRPLMNSGVEFLTGNRTYFVRKDGNDSNSGLLDTAAGAFLTIPKAAAVISGIALNGFTITVQVRSGTYTESFIIAQPRGPGNILLIGDTVTPANIIMNPTSNDCVNVSGGADCIVNVRGIEMRTTTGGQCVFAQNGGRISFNSVNFGACAGVGHVVVRTGGKIAISGSTYTINGNVARHIFSYDSGNVIAMNSMTVTLTGTPAFSVAFIDAGALSYTEAVGITYSGAATGTRFSVTQNAVVNTNGGGANYFPGNAAGATGTGGQYL